MKPIIILSLALLFLPNLASAQQQNFAIDALEFSECLPRWDRNQPKGTKAQRLKVRKQLLTLLKYEKDRRERVKLLHRLAVNYYQEYTASHTKKYLAESIKVLRKLIQDHPRYKKLGEVYLLLGEAMWQSGREKESLTIFKTFIKKHPQSPDAPRGYMFFGEFFFKQQHYEKARRMFQKAEALGSTDYAYCASHHIATCYHKLGKTQEAIEWLNKSAAIKGK